MLSLDSQFPTSFDRRDHRRIGRETNKLIKKVSPSAVGTFQIDVGTGERKISFQKNMLLQSMMLWKLERLIDGLVNDWRLRREFFRLASDIRLMSDVCD